MMDKLLHRACLCSDSARRGARWRQTLYFSSKDAAENYLELNFRRMAYDMWVARDGAVALTREAELPTRCRGRDDCCNSTFRPSLEKHRLWLRSADIGVRANLRK